MRKYLIRSPAAFALVALASACSVGPNFTRPEAPSVSGYTPPSEPREGEPVSPEFAQQIHPGTSPAAQWWAAFGSPQLDQLVQQAVAGNQTLVAAEATLRQAEELLAAQTGTRYPRADLSAGAARQQYGAQFLGPFHLPAFTAFGIGPTVRYTLDYTGGVARSIEQRQALAEYQRGQRDAAYLALTGNVVMQSIIIGATRAQIRALSDLLAEDRDNAKLVQTAFDNGSVSRLDVLTAQSQLASDETLLPPLRQQLQIAEHALAVLLGKAPAEFGAPILELSALRLPRELPLTIPSELVHRRPDILAAEAQLHAATAEVGIATANLYPRIDLSASVSQQALEPAHLFDAASNAWGLIANLSQPLFEGGTLRAERRAAVAALQASAASYRQTVLHSFGQVADVLDALGHDAELLAAQSNALNTAQSSVELARESYTAGNSGVLQVLDAQRLHQQAQLGFVRAQAQQYLDTAQLFLALGGSAL
jgi:NodT family efflux transporter outer membrane factor (OMF) lipoprotein